MFKYLLSFLVGKKLAEHTSIPGKSFDNTNIIVQERWYWKMSLVFSIFILAILIAFYFSEDGVGGGAPSTKDLIFYFLLIGVIVITSVLVLLFLLLYKIRIYDDYFELRKLFRYKRYDFSSVYLNNTASYTFVYSNNKYITRIPILLDNYYYLNKKYLDFFLNNKIQIPIGPDGYIKQSKAVLFLAICITIFFAIILTTIFFESKNVFYYSSPSVILIVPFYLYFYVWNISYDNEKMTYRNLFGFKKTYELKHLGWKYSNCGREIYYKEKKVCFYFEITDSSNLEVKIKDLNRYKKTNKSNKTKKPKKRR